MSKTQEKSCQACAHNTTERITPIYEDDYAHDIYGIDYLYKCKLHNVVIPYDYWCDKFELPF